MASSSLPISNPFADPFADPSIQNVISSARATAMETVEEPANPFTGIGGSNNKTVSETRISEEELKRRQDELKHREAELERRQRAFEQRQGGGGSIQPHHPHNWPPLPSFIPTEPCFYQDIDVEIPVEFQDTVRLIYNVYLVYVAALATNMIGTLIYFLFSKGNIGLLFLAIIQLGILTPCAYMIWFRPVYKAFRDDSSFNFLVFFFVLFFHSIFTLVQAIGGGGSGGGEVVSTYSVGWIGLRGIFSENFFIGVVMLVPTLGFTIAFLGMVYSLIRVYRFYSGTASAGFTFSKAREEFSRGVMSDRNVQNAAGAAARAAAAHAVNEATQGRF